MKTGALVLLALCSCAADAAFLQKNPGFDGFGAPDPFNRNDDDEVDANEPNAPVEHDSSDDANMVSEQEANAEDDDSFLQTAVAEPNTALLEEDDSDDDPNMVSESDSHAAEEEDSFAQFAFKSLGGKKDPYEKHLSGEAFLAMAKQALKKDGQDPDAQVDAGSPNAPTEDEGTDPNLVSKNQARSGEESLIQVHRKDPEFEDNPDEEDNVFSMEGANAETATSEARENRGHEFEEEEDEDDVEFLQQAKKALAKKHWKSEDPTYGGGVPTTESDVDAGEPNSPTPDDGQDQHYDPPNAHEEQLPNRWKVGSDVNKGETAFLQKDPEFEDNPDEEDTGVFSMNGDSTQEDEEKMNKQDAGHEFEEDEDDAFLQSAKKALKKKKKDPTYGGGVPTTESDVDAGEPNSPTPNDGQDEHYDTPNVHEDKLPDRWKVGSGVNKAHVGQEAFIQAAKHALKKVWRQAPSYGGAPNADDNVDATEPNAPQSGDDADLDDVRVASQTHSGEEGLLQRETN